MRPPPRLALALAFALVPLAGCEEPRQTGATPPPKPAAPKDTFIVGKRTQDVGKFDAAEQARKGGRVASTKITARDPITLTGNAYVTSIGRTSVMKIEQALDLFRASNDRFPAGHDEFMTEVIKANNIALPTLPSYQKYFYDEKEHKLLVIEYPELKAQPPQ